MSTRSRIGIIRERPKVRQFGSDRTKTKGRVPIVESIYCHFDGYPEGVGQTLLDHWTDEAKVNELIGLGDLSVLGEVIGEQHDFDSHTGGYVDGEYVEGEASKKGWCLFYRRDRGEQECNSVTHPIDEFPDYGQEAEYVFDPQDGTWRVRSEMLNPVGWNTVNQWEGWITIPEAIALNTQETSQS